VEGVSRFLYSELKEGVVERRRRVCGGKRVAGKGEILESKTGERCSARLRGTLQ
jgi:hypothetical protein